jgi:hypothetical protein
MRFGNPTVGSQISGNSIDFLLQSIELYFNPCYALTKLRLNNRNPMIHLDNLHLRGRSCFIA